MNKHIIKILGSIFVLSIITNLITFATASAEAEILVNVSGKGYYEYGDGWAISSLHDYNGANTRYSSEKNAIAQWETSLSRGSYEVFIYKIAQSDCDSNVAIDVIHANGTSSKYIDCNKGESEWISLGTYHFYDNGIVKAYHSNSDTNLRVGSVKFVQKSTTELEKPIDLNVRITNVTYSDVENSKYKRDIETVTRMGLMESANAKLFEPDGNFTRRELAKSIYRLTNGVVIGNCGASDVSEKDQDYFEISYAVNNKYMLLFEDNTFRPEDDVTGYEVLRALVTAAGYRPTVLSQSDTEAIWVKTAAMLKILDDIQLNMAKPISRGEYAKLLNNTLEVEPQVMDYSVGNSVAYSVKKSSTVLYEYLGIYKIKGVVTQNQYTGLYGKGSSSKLCIEIGGEPYVAANIALHDMLGQEVYAYIYEGNVLFAVPTNKTTITELPGDVIFDSSTIEMIEYEGNGRKDYKKVKIASDAAFIYNNVAVLGVRNEMLCPVSGCLKLIDNNDDGKADVVIIIDAIDRIVEDIDRTREKIYFKYEPDIFETLEYESNNENYVVFKDGIKVDFSEIQPGDVVSVVKSNDESEAVYWLYISTKTAEGYISEISQDEVTVSDIQYRYGKGLLSYSPSRELKTGTDVLLYLDYFGAIADFKITKGTDMYAYLYKCYEEPGANGWSMNLFTENEDHIIARSTSKTKINNGKFEDNIDLIYNEITNSVIPQIVKIRLNSQGELLRLTIADSSDTELEDNSFYRITSLPSRSVFRAGNQNIINSRYFVSDDVKIFVIPNSNDMNRKDYYHVYGKSYLKGNTVYNNNLQIYNVDADFKTDLIQITVSLDADNLLSVLNSPIAIVNDIYQAYFDDGEEGYTLSIKQVNGSDLEVNILGNDLIGYSAPTQEGIEGDKNVAAKDLKHGDVIQYETDNSGNIIMFRRLFSNDSATPFFEGYLSGARNEVSMYGDLYIAYGEVKKKTTGGMILLFPESTITDGTRAYPIRADIPVYLIDSKNRRKTIETGCVIERGDKVFAYTVQSQTRMYVVYR